jgi:hypothetical protein
MSARSLAAAWKADTLNGKLPMACIRQGAKNLNAPVSAVRPPSVK